MRTDLGPWRLTHELGRGAFGVTYAGEDPAGRQAAVKVLPGPAADELRALQGIAHPCIPAVLGFGAQPVHWVAVERVVGYALSSRRVEHVSEQQAIQWCAELMDALAHVHHDGWRHGDIKPDNLLIDTQTQALRLIDFGLSAATEGGTPAYAAPEVAGGKGGTASDVYSAALVFWELLFGALPWPQLGPIEALLRRRGERPVPEGAAPWQRAFFERALSVRPEDRATAAELALSLVDQGAELPLLGAQELRRRAQAIHLERPEDQGIDAWLEHGGLLTWRAPQGAGGRHQVRRAMNHLCKAEKPAVVMGGDGAPWSGVMSALMDPELGPPCALPAEATHRSRVVAAAEAILGRTPARLRVLVPRADALDAPSKEVLTLIAEGSRADILCVGALSLPGARALAWRPWDASELQSLAGALLPGLLLARETCEELVAEGEGRPALLPQALHWVLGKGGLRRGAKGFVVDADLLLQGARAQDPLNLGDLAGKTLELAELLELAGRIPLRALERIWTGAHSRLLASLGELRGRGLLSEEPAGIALVTGASGRLAPGAERSVRLHRVLLQWALSTQVSAPRLLALALGGEDIDLAWKLAPQAVEELCPGRWRQALTLGERLWGHRQGPELADLLVHAHLCGGAWDEAVKLLPACSTAGVLELIGAWCGAGELDKAEALLTELGPPESTLGHRLAWATLHFRRASYEVASQVAAARGELGDATDREAWAGLVLVHAQALLAQANAAAALEVLESAPLADLPEGSKRVLESARGRVLVALQRSSEAIAVMSPLAARGGGLPALERARTLLNLGTALYISSERQRAVAAWEESLLLFERLHSERDVLRLRVNLCVACRESGRGERAVEVGRAAVAGARAAGLPQLEAVAQGNLGEAHASLGQVDEAWSAYADCRALAIEHQLLGERVELARREAELASKERQGDALDRARFALRLAQEAELPGEASRARALLVLARARQGAGEDIDDELAELEAPLVARGLANDLANVRGWAARAYIALGRPDAARSLLDRVLGFAREVGHLEMEGQVLALLDELGEVGLSEGEGPLERLLELTRHLRADMGQDELLEQVCELALELIPDAERAFVALGVPPVVASSVIRVGVEEPPPSSNILRRAVESGREILATDLGERGDLQGFQSVANMRMRSVLCVPLVQGGDSVGALYLDSYKASEGQLRRTVRILRGLASFAALAVVSARVREREIRQREMAQSLERALADAKRATQAKDRFLANMSHELRTPLNGILGMLDLLERSSLSPDQVEMLQTIRDSGGNLLGLISQVLDYARLEALGPSLSEAPMLLREVCEGAVGLVSTHRVQAGVEVVARIPPALWSERRGDATRLQQVLVNLLDNAVRFSETGGTVVLRVRPVGTTQISFEVEDHGCGIAEEAMRTIFEPFNQVDESDHRRHGGAGLGLSIAREATALMGGQLECVSRVGEGTRFFFTLTMEETGPSPVEWPDLSGRVVAVQAHNLELRDQLQEVLLSWGASLSSLGKEDRVDLVIRTPEHGGALPKAEVLWLLPSGGALIRPVSAVRLAEQVWERLGPPEEHSADSSSEVLGELPHAKILVVEDNPINRMVLCRMLRTMGLEVVEAVDGIEALERFTPDLALVLMDCQLPHMDGYEATRRLRAQGVQVPILAVTARAQPGDRALCLDAGMDDYMTKPLTLPTLIRALRVWLKATPAARRA